MADRRGLLIILSSPSGAGKSTLARMLRDWDPTMAFSTSATTRAPREGETDGEDYHFMTREEFQASIDAGDMIEYAEVFGNMYGSPRRPVEAALDAGRDVLFDIDWQGTQQIRQSPLGRDALSIFVLPPTIAELERRLKKRGQDSDKIIRNRMQRCMAEISHWAEYDFVLKNDNLEATFEKLQRIVSAIRLRRVQQPFLSQFVRDLNAEFEKRNGS